MIIMMMIMIIIVMMVIIDNFLQLIEYFIIGNKILFNLASLSLVR